MTTRVLLLQGAAIGGATFDPVQSGVWERLGVAGILVVASYFMLRYFIAQLARKDERLDVLVNKFIEATEKFGDLAREGHRIQAESATALRELKDVIMDRRAQK